jgi:hypothetical protein
VSSSFAVRLSVLLLPPRRPRQPAVNVDPPTGEVGLRMNVNVSVEGEQGADCSLLESPAVQGARLTLVQGPVTSSSTTIVNGRVSRSLRTEWSFLLIPEQVGTLEVPPFRFNCRGAEPARGRSSEAASRRGRDLWPEVWPIRGAVGGQTFTTVGWIDDSASRSGHNGLELTCPGWPACPGC